MEQITVYVAQVEEQPAGDMIGGIYRGHWEHSPPQSYELLVLAMYIAISYFYMGNK